MNSFQSISGDSENSSVTRRGVSRRSVMKAGAAAAWSVPLVQVVAAAPAMAAVSGQAVLDISGSGAWGPASAPENKPLQATLQVKNTGGQSATLLAVVLAFPAGYAPTARPNSLPTGWSASGNGTPSITLSASGTVIAPATTFSFNPVFDLANANNRGKAVEVGLTANASGGIQDAGVLTVSKG